MQDGTSAGISTIDADGSGARRPTGLATVPSDGTELGSRYPAWSR